MTQYYPAIPTATIERLLGSEDFAIMMAFIKRKYSTKRIVIGRSSKGPMVFLKDPTGKQIGTVARVLRKAKYEQGET